MIDDCHARHHGWRQRLRRRPAATPTAGSTGRRPKVAREVAHGVSLPATLTGSRLPLPTFCVASISIVTPSGA